MVDAVQRRARYPPYIVLEAGIYTLEEWLKQESRSVHEKMCSLQHVHCLFACSSMMETAISRFWLGYMSSTAWESFIAMSQLRTSFSAESKESGN